MTYLTKKYRATAHKIPKTIEDTINPAGIVLNIPIIIVSNILFNYNIFWLECQVLDKLLTSWYNLKN